MYFCHKHWISEATAQHVVLLLVCEQYLIFMTSDNHLDPGFLKDSSNFSGFNDLDGMDFMKRALELGAEALAAQEVPVGCVFTRNGTIVAESRNSVNITHNPTRHAEINCIDTVIDYCKSSSMSYVDYFKNIIVYVTVEPCIMCAAALRQLEVQKVVYGCANDRFGGSTVLNIRNYYDHNYELVGNLMADEAMALLKQFYQGTNPNAPESKVKKKS